MIISTHNIMIFQPHNLSGTNYLWTKISGLGKKLKFSIEVEKGAHYDDMR